VYSIGEFSRITGLTVKTLRFYHEKALLVPRCVDESSKYRYYAETQVETARIIARLRTFEFSLEQIAEIFVSQHSDEDILTLLERHKQLIDQKQKQYREIAHSLEIVLLQERTARMASHTTTQVPEEKTLAPMLIAGVRMKGKYSDCGPGFGKLGRTFGRHITGPGMMLQYDGEYKENDADFESCFPIKQGHSTDDISVRELPGGRFVCMMHQGPYNEMGRTYATMLDYFKKKGLKYGLPTREIYIKGPGMIFKGNPKNYLTEIQIPVEG
jgi:DNA-binding transcriptional MerR regulator/effector-binding domain-containing protein